MKRMVFAVLLAVTMLLPCFSFAEGQELILENFEDAGIMQKTMCFHPSITK